jgi:signal peptidase II
MILIGVSLLVLALDQFTKFLVVKSLVLNQSVPLCSDILCLTYTQNTGTAFGLLANLDLAIRIPFFIAITLVAGFIVYTYQRLIPADRNLARVALGLIWGGAMGNFVDRIFNGRVIDFIDVGFHQCRFYVFNVADSCITIGLVFLLCEFFFLKPKVEKMV